MSLIFPYPIRCCYPYIRWMYDLCTSNTPSDVSFYNSLGTGYSCLRRFVALFALLAFAS
jgi:hypothetical protein